MRNVLPATAGRREPENNLDLPSGGWPAQKLIIEKKDDLPTCRPQEKEVATARRLSCPATRPATSHQLSFVRIFGQKHRENSNIRWRLCAKNNYADYWKLLNSFTFPPPSSPIPSRTSSSPAPPLREGGSRRTPPTSGRRSGWSPPCGSSWPRSPTPWP